MFLTNEQIFAIEKLASSSHHYSKYLNELLISLMNCVYSSLDDDDLPKPVLIFENDLSAFSSDQMKQAYAEGFAQGFIAAKIQEDEDEEHGTWIHVEDKQNLYKPFSKFNPPKEPHANRIRLPL